MLDFTYTSTGVFDEQVIKPIYETKQAWAKAKTEANAKGQP